MNQFTSQIIANSGCHSHQTEQPDPWQHSAWTRQSPILRIGQWRRISLQIKTSLCSIHSLFTVRTCTLYSLIGAKWCPSLFQFACSYTGQYQHRYLCLHLKTYLMILRQYIVLNCIVNILKIFIKKKMFLKERDRYIIDYRYIYIYM